MSIYDIFTPASSPINTRRRHSSSYISRRSKRNTETSISSSIPFPIPQVLPPYVRPGQSSNSYNHTERSYDMSPGSPIQGMIPTRPSTPSLSPTSSHSSIAFPSLPQTPGAYFSTGIIFFPQHDLTIDDDDEEEEDFFAATYTPSRPSLIKRNLFTNFHGNNGGKSLGSSLGLGEVAKLPDEPSYPKQLSFNPSQNGLSTTTKQNSFVPLPSTYQQNSTVPSTSNEGLLLPSPTLTQGQFGGKPIPKEKREEPFGHSFLPPLPKIKDGPIQPLVPMGFLSYHPKSPPSSWRSPQSQSQPQSHISNGQQKQIEIKSKSPTSPLKRTDSEILLPSSFSSSPSSWGLDTEEEQIQRPRLYGHMRKSSNDSQLTIKLGNGFIALSPSTSQNDSDYFRPSHQNINPNQGNSTIRPNISRHVSQQVPTNRMESIQVGNRGRSSSASQVTTQQKPKQSKGNQIKRPVSPYKPCMSSPLINGRPTSPIPFAFAMDEDYLQEHRNDNSSNYHNQKSSYGTSRFTRPISPSLPEDLLTPGYSPTTYTHQTLSCAPRRPKSPITAKEHLNAVLTRHPSKTHDRGKEDDDEEEDSLDRMVQAAQRLESGSSYSSYQPKTPPKSPSSRPQPSHELQSSYNLIHKPKPKRGILKTLFPPTPPPSSPPISTLNPDDSPPSSIFMDAAMRIASKHPKQPFDVDKVSEGLKIQFDADKVSETLKHQNGRISFAELEGFDHSSLLNDENGDEEEDEENDEENDEVQVELNSKDNKGKKGKRPGSSRRWTLPF